MYNEKLEVTQSLLDKHDNVFLHLTPTTYSVRARLPQPLLKQEQVILQVGYNMTIPIPDMKVDDLGFFGTLSFKGIPFACNVPWQCIFAVIGPDGLGKVWEADMPISVYNDYKDKNKTSLHTIDFDKKKTEKYLKPVKKIPPGWGVIQGGGQGSKK